MSSVLIADETLSAGAQLQMDEVSPSPLRQGPQTSRGRGQLLLSVAEDESYEAYDYLMEQRRLVHHDHHPMVCTVPGQSR